MLRSVVDAEKLIEEVKKRPALYDGSKSSSTHMRLRNSLWEEISQEIFREVWDTSDRAQKESFTRELQTKWRSIRDAYNRACKQAKEDRLSGKPRRRYIYSDLLTFLEKNDDSNSSLNTIYLQEDTTDRTDDDDFEYFTENSNPLQSSSGGGGVDGGGGGVVSDNTAATVSSSSSSSTTAIGKISECLRQLVTMQKEDRSDDKMGNKKFLLSLLPFMERLPDDVNLEVRLQLMSVIQTYSNGEHFMKM